MLVVRRVIDMLSIDEAIAHAREKAKEIRENIIDGDNLEPYESYCNTMIAKSAEKYEQLAEWLEELKEIKSNGRYVQGNKAGQKIGYRNAIDDFVNACKSNTLCQTFGLRQCDIDELAEQLKAGEKE